MNGVDPKPTPVSGMPAAVAATSAAQPSKRTEEIRAPKSEASEILAAVHELRDEVTKRFERLETTQGSHGDTLRTLTNQVAENTKHITELTSAQVSVAKSAAVAADLSAQALAKANTSQDDARKMVESAMTIQKGAIASAVTEAVRPIQGDVDKTTEAVSAIVNELGIEDRVQLGREVKPGEKTPTTALKKLESRSKNSQAVQVIVAIGVIVNALYQLLSSGHH